MFANVTKMVRPKYHLKQSFAFIPDSIEKNGKTIKVRIFWKNNILKITNSHFS